MEAKSRRSYPKKIIIPPKMALGPFSAELATDNSLPSIELCIKAAADYFSHTQPRQSAGNIANDRLAEALADANRALYVLEDKNNQKAGLLELAIHTPQYQEATIILLVLGQKWRGWGWGRDAVLSLLVFLKQAGIEHLCLGVAPNQSEAAEFWLSLGFWEVGEEEGVRLFEYPLVSREIGPPSKECQ